jgi:glycosidase
MNTSLYPLLYQVNTRVWMTELSYQLGRPATLDDIPDSALDQFRDLGFDWIWFLSVWQTGKAGQAVSRLNGGWRKEFEDTLPDLKEEDIEGSGFAIVRYVVSEKLGGNDALARLRKRLDRRGLKLMLDFVPNHTAIDHDWVVSHPEFYISATELELEREPMNYVRTASNNGDIILAYGRDPYFSGWPDTLQLNYSNPDLQEAMIGELTRIATQCDGLRCDMAMLVLPDVFERTWGTHSPPFWPEAIRRIHTVSRDFCMMAEVYWDLEWAMLQQGFDYTYDKRLYDRLKDGHVKQVREHFYAGLDFQIHMARFLENHDEHRVALDFTPDMHEAAAILTFLSPGLRFFHQGQLEGRKKKVSPHLVRAPEEPGDERLHLFYSKLLDILHWHVFKNGDWKLAECIPAWEGNQSDGNYISFAWQGEQGENILIAVNYSPDYSQCFVKLPFNDLPGKTWSLHDLMSGNIYGRDGDELSEKGLYLDEPGWKVFVFLLSRDKSDV